MHTRAHRVCKWSSPIPSIRHCTRVVAYKCYCHCFINSTVHIRSVPTVSPSTTRFGRNAIGGRRVTGSTFSNTLLSVIANLLETSPNSQQQFLHSKGFLVISDALTQANSAHLTMAVLEQFINIGKFLLASPIGVALVKQLFDYIFFNARLWIHADVQVCMRVRVCACGRFNCVCTPIWPAIYCRTLNMCNVCGVHRLSYK
jgi:hypothetical protein